MPAVVSPIDELAAEIIEVENFRLTPIANLGSEDDRWEWHPKGLAGIGWDSDPRPLDPGVGSDFYYRLMAGIEGRYFGSEQSLLRMDAELELQRYLDTDGRDLLLGSGDLDWTREGSLWRYQGQLGVRITDDPLVISGEQVERRRFTARGDATRQGLLREISFGFAVDREDFAESGSGFDPSERDNYSLRAHSRYGQDLAERSSWFAELRVSSRRYDEDGRFQDSIGVTAVAGVRAALGERMQIAAKAGVAWRSFEDDFAENVSFDDELIVAPVGSVRITWPWKEEGKAELGLSVRLVDSISSNAAFVYGFDGLVKTPVRKDIDWYAEGAYFLTEDSGSALGNPVRDTTSVIVTTGLEWRFREGMSLRGEGAYMNHEDNVDRDFDRLRTSLVYAVAF